MFASPVFRAGGGILMLVFAATTLAMIAFATNALFCRLALLEGGMPHPMYTAIRLFSGAVMLAIIMLCRRRLPWSKGSWAGAASLFAYMAFFSWAFVRLSSAAGTLVLCVAVQTTMMAYSLLRGERPRPLALLGFGLSLAGLIVLLFRGLSAPPLGSAALMLASGTAWGVYCLCGLSKHNPIDSTAGNFLRAVPFLLLLLPWIWGDAAPSLRTCLYAVAAGAICSALGYVLWYVGTQRLTVMTASVVQLSVPLLAAWEGLLFLNEPFSARMALSAAGILGGIFLTSFANRPGGTQKPS